MACKLFPDGAVQVCSLIHNCAHLVHMCVPSFMYGGKNSFARDYSNKFVLNNQWATTFAYVQELLLTNCGRQIQYCNRVL